MAAKRVVIENPILNSPFFEPSRHFRFSEDGITDEIVENRRISQYFIPIAPPKKKGVKQLSFETEWTADRIEENKFIMGETLLKKTGAANLFMVFGEPDVEIKPRKDGQVEVSVRGVDVYDPTTGEIRSHGTDDIACWFVDTDYNGESFFVRQACFTGADEPYEKLRRALRAEIDEAAWAALSATKSYPFDPPKTGKIAVKVINHYGDEVMKVYPL